MRKMLSWPALLLCLLPGFAQAAQSSQDRWPLELRTQMLRLAEVDWRLRVAAVARCPRQSSGTGLWIDHARAYALTDRALVQRLLRLGERPQIAAVAEGSPAARAGIRPGDELVAIGSVTLADTLEQSADPALFAEQVMDHLAALPPQRPATLELRRGGTSLRKIVVPLPICAARTLLETHRSLAAYSDRRDLAVTSALIAFTANDDELALIVGHELAHVVLHGDTDFSGSKPLSMEQEADRLGAELAHCAGYDTALGAAFWPRYRQQDAQALERLPSHPSPELREESIRAALSGFACPVSLSAEAPQR